MGLNGCAGVGGRARVRVYCGVGVAVSSWAYVRVSVWVCGCSGARAYWDGRMCVSWLKHCICLFLLFCFSLYQHHAVQHNLHWSLHTMIRSLRSRMAMFLDFFEVFLHPPICRGPSLGSCSTIRRSWQVQVPVVPQPSTEDTRRNDFAHKLPSRRRRRSAASRRRDVSQLPRMSP